MNSKMYAADLMTRQVRSVRVQSDLSEAMRVMDDGGFDQVPVLDGDRPVQLLTLRDALRALRDGNANRPVGELASPLPCLLSPDAPLSQVVQALQDRDSLLILGDDGRLEGIITYWDVLKIARPHLLVAEAELLLRKRVAEVYEAKYGKDWWSQIPPDLRRQAEEEQARQHDAIEGSYSEHMLGHTSMWSLIAIYRQIRPDAPTEKFHRVREWRNKVAHLYVLTDKEIAELIRDTLAMRDILEKPDSPTCP
jgi:hypothetical protein